MTRKPKRDPGPYAALKPNPHFKWLRPPDHDGPPVIFKWLSGEDWKHANRFPRWMMGLVRDMRKQAGGEQQEVSIQETGVIDCLCIQVVRGRSAKAGTR